MAETRDLAVFVKPAGEGALAMELAVEGIHCGGCIRKVETGLKKIDGIIDARVNFTNRRLNVLWADPAIKHGALVQSLVTSGY